MLIVLTALGVAGLLYYEGFVTKELDSGDIAKAVLILAGLVLAAVRTKKPRRQVSNKKVAYEKAYPDFIQNVFSEDKKLEKKFFHAVDDYNQNKPAAALKKLEALRKDCQRTSDLYAVTVFTALCLDEMRAYEKAIQQYYGAFQIRPNSTLASNMGLCYERLGEPNRAIDAYTTAIQTDKTNAFAFNNLGTLYFREGDYETALEYAEAAIAVNPRMPQALSLAAICSAVMGQQEPYQRYYRQAVAAGYDGSKIKAVIKSLDPEL